MAGKDKNAQPSRQQAEQLVDTIQSFLEAVGGIDLKALNEDVQSLKFDNERIVKPALTDIRNILSRDIYAPKSEVAELKAEIEKLKKELADEKERTRNYGIVEKVVFGLVGMILVAVVGAVIALVVVSGNGGGK